MKPTLASAILSTAVPLAMLSGCDSDSAAEDPATPDNALAAYVAKADDSYGWKVRRDGKVGPAEWVELTVTSQMWRDIEWKHQLFLIRPSTAREDCRHAVLFIAGGSWSDRLAQPPAEDEELPRQAAVFAGLAEQMKTPVAVVLQVPHQPLFDGRYEDAIIAYTFEQYLQTGDAEWPLLLPMTKAAAAAMDAVGEYAQQKWKRKIDRFTVTGASKRGWTTWLIGAVDKRAVALAPTVIDMLKIDEHLALQKKSWGEYSPQLRDYTERGLPRHLATEGGRALTRMVDPIHYAAKYRQPTLIILGTNDAYWPLDAANLYWDDLTQPKYLLYVPNNGHGIRDYARTFGALRALHHHVALDKPLPNLGWKFAEKNGAVRVTMDSYVRPAAVRLWTATASKRDFREANFKPTDELASLTPPDAAISRCIYVRDVRLPESGYLAVFGEYRFEDADGPYYFSTNVRIYGAP